MLYSAPTDKVTLFLQTWHTAFIPIIRTIPLEVQVVIRTNETSREKHDENHQPMMQKGVTIKHNANQRYATTSITAFLLKELARRHSVPIQVFSSSLALVRMLKQNTGICSTQR